MDGEEKSILKVDKRAAGMEGRRYDSLLGRRIPGGNMEMSICVGGELADLENGEFISQCQVKDIYFMEDQGCAQAYSGTLVVDDPRAKVTQGKYLLRLQEQAAGRVYLMEDDAPGTFWVFFPSQEWRAFTVPVPVAVGMGG